MTDGIAKIIDACRNLGDRYKYPHGTFSMGITKFAKMKGIEKFGCVFYLVLFLNTDLANTYYFEGDKKIKDEDTKQMLKKWRHLFETCLYYHDWIMKRSF